MTIPMFTISRSQKRCLKKKTSTPTTMATIARTESTTAACLPIVPFYYAPRSRARRCWRAASEILPVSVAGVNPAMDRDARTRIRLEQHWKASEDGDADAEHAIYAADAVLDYPQSGERFRGRSTIQAQRGGHPAERHFTILRIRGGGDLWVSECLITYDNVPTYSVSVMEFADDLVAHETQYFADPFQAPAWRVALADPAADRDG